MNIGRRIFRGGLIAELSDQIKLKIRLFQRGSSNIRVFKLILSILSLSVNLNFLV